MSRSEKPRSEPEIIPPGRQRDTRRERIFTDARSTERIYVARIRPFGVILGMLMVVVLSAVALALLLGALLISLPLVIAFIAGAIITVLLRPFFREGRRSQHTTRPSCRRSYLSALTPIADKGGCARIVR